MLTGAVAPIGCKHGQKQSVIGNFCDTRSEKKKIKIMLFRAACREQL